MALNDQDRRGQSPILPFAHRAIMGGAADLPQRSSSPLKRRASDLDGEDDPKAEATSNQEEDVDMVTVPQSGLPEGVNLATTREQSIDMLKDAQDGEAPDTTGLTQPTSEVNLKNGMLTNVQLQLQ